VGIADVGGPYHYVPLRTRGGKIVTFRRNLPEVRRFGLRSLQRASRLEASEATVTELRRAVR
jgi:hypothetical protein